MTHYITGIRLYNMFCARGSNECNQWRSEGGGGGGAGGDICPRAQG